MKREKKSPTKVKSRKISTSSSSSVDQSHSETKATTAKQQKQKETRVLVEESNKNVGKQANVTIRMKNADMLAKYRSNNPDIQIVNPTTTTNFSADEISDDDEIWLFDVPASIDVSKFVGKTIKLGSKKSTIKTDDGEFEYNSSKFESPNGINQNTLSVLFQNKDAQFSIKNLKPVGQLMFHQKIDSTDVPTELTPRGRHECTIFPQNLKTRHPLLGHQFEDKIELNPTIKNKLTEAKMASEQTQPSVRVKQEREENGTNSQTTSKKSKKRRTESTEDTVSPKKLKVDIKVESGHDDDLAMIKEIFAKN